MQPYTGSDGNPRAILNKCSRVKLKIDELDIQLNSLRSVFKNELAQPGMFLENIKSLNSQIKESYSTLVNDVMSIKSQPRDNRAASQVNFLERRLTTNFERYKGLQADFERDSRTVTERQCRIILGPDATDDEIGKAVADPDRLIFRRAVCIPFSCSSHSHAAANLLPSSLATLATQAPPSVR